MAGPIKILRWILQTSAIAGFALAVAVAAAGLWLALRAPVDFETWRVDRIRSFNVERAKLQSALVNLQTKMAKITADLAAGQERIRQTEGVIGQLKGLDSTWDKLTGDPQQKANSDRREKLEQQQAESRAKLAAQQADYTRSGWERDGLEIDLTRLEVQLKAAEVERSKVMHYLSQAWNHRVAGMKVRAWAFLLFGLGVAGVTLWKRAMDPELDRPR